MIGSPSLLGSLANRNPRAEPSRAATLAAGPCCPCSTPTQTSRRSEPGPHWVLEAGRGRQRPRPTFTLLPRRPRAPGDPPDPLAGLLQQAASPARAPPRDCDANRKWKRQQKRNAEAWRRASPWASLYLKPHHLAGLSMAAGRGGGRAASSHEAATTHSRNNIPRGKAAAVTKRSLAGGAGMSYREQTP